MGGLLDKLAADMEKRFKDDLNIRFAEVHKKLDEVSKKLDAIAEANGKK